MDSAAVLQAFNVQVRQSTRPDGTGAVLQRDGAVVRRVAARGQDEDRPSGSGVLWSDLDPGKAEAVIAAQVAFFGGRGEEFEWKLYSYDQPPDLAERLLAAGFVPEEAEALMVAEVSRVPQPAQLPAGIRLERVTDASGIDQLAQVHQRVFGQDESGLHATLLAQLGTAPEMIEMVLAMAGDEVVSAARIEFVPGSDFAACGAAARCPPGAGAASTGRSSAIGPPWPPRAATGTCR